MKIKIFEDKDVLISIKLLIPIIIFIGISILSYFIIEDYLNVNKLANSGVTTTGTITSVKKDVQRRNSTSTRKSRQTEVDYYVRYEFTVNNEKYNVRRTVGTKVYNSTKVGDTISILYEENNPDNNYPVLEADNREEVKRNAIFRLIIIYGALAAGIIIVTIDIKRKIKVNYERIKNDEINTIQIDRILEITKV